MEVRRRSTVAVEQTIAASLDVVWDAIVHLHRWWPDTTLEPVLGGRFTEWWTDEHGRRRRTTGRVLAIHPPDHLRLAWSDDDWSAETVVDVLLEGAASGAAVRLEHCGFDRLGPDGERLADAHLAGWRHHLDALRAHCEPALGATG